jgi:RNA polymerase sigma factor (sigma-70 family)
LCNDADAEEVTQECFLKLATGEAQIRVSLGGWLHRLATHRSIDRIRSDQRRIQREQVFSGQGEERIEATWDDIQSYVDEAIADLPDKLREPVLRHFVCRETHGAIAESLEISRPAVTQRINRGIEAIRKTLMKRGIPVSVLALGALLTGNMAQAAPVALAGALGKCALSGLGATGQSALLTSIGGGIALMGKKLALILGAIAIAAVTYNLATHPPSEPAETILEPSMEVFSATSPGKEPSPPLDQDPVTDDAVSQEPAPGERPPTVEDFGDLWAYSLRYGDVVKTENVLESRWVKLRVQGWQLTAAYEEGQLLAEGKRDGRLVTLDLFESDNEVLPMTGQFNEAFTELRAQGKRYRSTVYAVFTRLTQAQIQSRALAEEQSGHVKLLYDILRRYADDHGGGFPPELGQLVPDYVEDLQDFASTEDRKVEYDPKAGIKPRKGSGLQDISMTSEVPYPDQLVALEKSLQEHYGVAIFFPKPLLRVTYQKPRLIVTASPWGNIETEAAEERTRTNARGGSPTQEDLRDSCAENLKQLALITRMFDHEMENYIQGGWWSTYPEYLTDPSVLTCPLDPPGTISYTLLFPATHVSFFDEIAGAVSGIPLEEIVPGSGQAVVPLIIEQSVHNGDQPGRVTAFVDGHVEFVRLEEWDEAVTPYLKYR